MNYISFQLIKIPKSYAHWAKTFRENHYIFPFIFIGNGYSKGEKNWVNPDAMLFVL